MQKKVFQGFTYLELIFVIVIVSILAATVVPRWFGNTANLDAQAQQLLSDLRYTQSLAITKNLRFRLNIISSNSYTISQPNGTLVVNPGNGLTAVTLTNATITSNNLPNNLIAFDGRGIPYIDAAASIPLATNATIMIGNKTIQITPQTGWATVL